MCSNYKHVLVLETLTLGSKIPTDQYEQPWSRYNSTDQPYMHLKAHEHTMGSQFHKHACELYSLFADYIS